MHFSNMDIFSRILRRFCGIFAKVLASRDGNFALTFAFLSIPMLLSVGISIDYVRAYNVKVKMQADLDAALIASVKEVDSLSEDQIKDKVAKWFVAQAETQDVSSYTLAANAIVVSKSKRTISAVATGLVPTTFLGLANIKTVPVSVTTSVAGPATSYLNVYIVLDKSASMLLAATTSGQTLMKTYAQSNCVFACHVSEGNSKKYNGRTYPTNYELAKAMGVQLRADVSVSAAQEVLDLVTTADPTQSRIKVGLYSIGTKAKEVLAPEASMSAVKTALLKDANGLTGATSQDTTDFKTSLVGTSDNKGLESIIGAAGDGNTKETPLKLVLMLTDGVQSQRPWVTTNVPSDAWNCATWSGSICIKYRTKDFPYQTNVTPLNPDWCKGMKEGAVTMGVLYTEYLSIPMDWGYNGTVGDTMKSSAFSGKLQDGVSSSTSRHDYIPYALTSCATSEEMFISAADPAAIKAGLSKLLGQYLGSVRLTQ
jgi:Flp pilus assembly protein TadG